MYTRRFRALPFNLKIRDSGFDIRDRGLAPERGLELSLGWVPIPDPTADPGGDRAGSFLAPADGEHSLHAALILKTPDSLHNVSGRLLELAAEFAQVIG
jgi:hypothetical protein